MAKTKKVLGKVVRPPTTQRFLITVVGDVEPELSGPFKSNKARLKVAREHREQDDEDLHDGLFWLDIKPDGTPEIGSFAGAVFPDPEDGERVSWSLRQLIASETFQTFHAQRGIGQPPKGAATIHDVLNFVLTTVEQNQLGEFVRYGHSSIAADVLLKELDALKAEHGDTFKLVTLLELPPWPVEICAKCDMPYVKKPQQSCPCQADKGRKAR